MTHEPAAIRPARTDEGPDLTELTLRSKSHWGYDGAFLETARTYLTIDAETIRANRLYVLEQNAHVIGFYGLADEPPHGRLEWLFLEPAEIGHGHGRRLWEHALDRARAAGFTDLEIESDRYAEPFYRAMGATRIGATPSPVDGAELPLFRVTLDG